MRKLCLWSGIVGCIFASNANSAALLIDDWSTEGSVTFTYSGFDNNTATPKYTFGGGSATNCGTKVNGGGTCTIPSEGQIEWDSAGAFWTGNTAPAPFSQTYWLLEGSQSVGGNEISDTIFVQILSNGQNTRRELTIRFTSDTTASLGTFDFSGHTLGTDYFYENDLPSCGVACGLLTLTYGTGPTALTLSVLNDRETVPEPATLALFGIGLAGLGFSRRKQ